MKIRFANPAGAAALLLLLLLQSGCGWVDTGVDGNQPPDTTRGQDAYEVAEGATLTVPAPGVLGNDADGGNRPLQAKLISSTAHGTLEVDTGSDGLFDGGFRYTHDGSDEPTEDSFTYKAYDGIDYSAETEVHIAIKPVNDSPVAAGDNAVVDEGGSVEIDLTSNDADPEGDPLSAELLTQPAHGSVTMLSEGRVRYTHDGSEPVGDAATDSFTYRATDGTDSSAAATVTLTIQPTNDPPVAVADSAAVDEGAQISLAVLENDTDPDGDPLSIVLAAPAPSHGTVTVSGQTIVYTHDGSDTLSDTFGYKASDGTASSAAVTVSITVNPIDDAPAAVDDAYTVVEGGSLDGSPGVLDNDLNLTPPVAVSVATPPTHATAFTLNADGTFSYTHDGSETDADTFSYRVTDAAGADLAADVRISVTPVNDPPLAGDVCTDVARATSVTITLPGTDAETPANALLYSVTQPSGGQVSTTNTAEVTYTPHADAPWGADTFTYTVTDGDGASASGTVDVVIKPRIMPLGDSITAGVTGSDGPPPEGWTGYRKALYTALTRDGYHVDFVGSRNDGGSDFDSDHEGHPGALTANFLNQTTSCYTAGPWSIDQLMADNPADFVLLHVGTNDMNCRFDPVATAQNVDQILSAISQSGSSTLLAQIIGINDTSGKNDALKTYNSELAARFASRAELVDQYAAFDQDANGIPDPGLYSNTLHPNAEGYQVMAQTWLLKLEARLGAARCPVR